MSYKTLELQETEAGIGLLTLNRPDRLNAIDLEMVKELQGLFHELHERREIRVLILTGAGRGFCSGADLKSDLLTQVEFEDTAHSAPAHLELIQKRYAGLIKGLRNIPQPVIAAVNGHAAGGGMTLALASDVIYASPEASFTPSFINIGLSGGELGTSYFLPRMVGTARAAEILMTGRTVTAEEADRIGLITRLVPADSLLGAATETARMMLTKSVHGLRLTKETIRQNLDAPSLENAIELENRNQSMLCTTPEYFASIARFRKGKG